MKFPGQMVLLLLFAILTTGCVTMNKTVTKMFDGIDVREAGGVSGKDLERLPAVVQNYLRYTGIIGKERAKSVRLKQGGGFRLKPGQSYKRMKAVQYYDVDAMEFFWQGKVNIITATDRFLAGKGDLTVKLLGFIKVAYAEGPEVDQGEMLRFLTEGVWFPSVFVNSYIRWQAVGARAARATITQNNLSVSATFYFNEKNQVERITARRYMETDGKFKLADWEILAGEYKMFNGVLIPARADVIWKLDSGDFCYYKLEIYDIEYNVPLPYQGGGK